jgi:DNA-binding CsgD family transcriptional regulator
MFLLDGYGCLLRANAAGYALLAEDTCLILKDNSLRPTLQVDCAEFERLIAVTCGTGSGRGVFPGGYMLLHRKVGRPLHCKVTPFCSDNNFFGTAPSAIVFIGNPEKAPVARSKALRSLYRLTPAESELADLLLAGETIASAAERRHISEASARTQLKSILHKTGTKRQSELIRLSLNIPV